MLWPVIEAVKRARGLPAGSVDDVVRHIDHIARLVGVEHVALGSDFDGVPQLPVGLHDVTRLPWITYGLLRLGYSEEDLYQMLGGNTLRVLEAADKQAKSR
jgi:membrane dipeptidase